MTPEVSELQLSEADVANLERQEILEGKFDVMPTPEEEHELALIKEEVARYKANYHTAFSNQ